MRWLVFFTLQLSFIFIIISVGYWISSKYLNRIGLKKTFWIDRICIAAFITIFLFAILGIFILFLPRNMRQLISGLILACLFLASLYTFISNKYYKYLLEVKYIEKIFLIGVIIMSGLGLSLSLLPVKLPTKLIDGPYVAKHDYLGVRIQYITGNLPTDNSLPHVVSEYLLRDISFKKEHPIMPGQEISNRPILVSLLLVPIRAAFSPPPKLPNGLPKFNYVGNTWPDFSVLMKDDFGYLFSLSIGITLNALILLSVGAFAIRISNQSKIIAFSVVALMISSPYFIFQTIFTWPKELAAFFVLYSILLYYKLKSPSLSGAFLAFGYLSHPYVVVFFIGFILYEIYNLFKNLILQIQTEKSEDKENSTFNTKFNNKNLTFNKINTLTKKLFFHIKLLKKRDFKNIIYFLATFGILVTPWFIWSRIILHISSDLISQNFFQNGQSLIDFFWIRPVNFFNATLPVYLLHYPFNLNNLVLDSSVTIPGAIGILIFGFSLMYLYECSFEKNKTFFVYIPSLLLIFIFSNQAVPTLHGLQGPVALLLLVGVVQIQKMFSNTKILFTLLSSQIVINIFLLGNYFYSLV